MRTRAAKSTGWPSRFAGLNFTCFAACTAASSRPWPSPLITRFTCTVPSAWKTKSSTTSPSSLRVRPPRCTAGGACPECQPSPSKNRPTLLSSLACCLPRWHRRSRRFAPLRVYRRSAEELPRHFRIRCSQPCRALPCCRRCRSRIQGRPAMPASPAD